MATIQERKRKNGKIAYTATIRLKGASPISATFDRLTDAKDWVQQNEPKIKRGKHLKEFEAKRHTLSELIERYIKYELPKRKSDHQKFKMQLTWWENKIGFYLLSDITPSLIAEYRDVLKNEPSVKELKDGGRIEIMRSNGTVNHYLATLSIAISIAVDEWGWLEENPIFKVTKMRGVKGRTRFLTDKERQALLAACDKASNPLFKLLVVLALSTGARYSEILYLRWQDVNFGSRMLYFMDTKNGENRAVPVSKDAYALLEEHSKVRKINSDYVFARPDGKKPADLRWQWEEAIKKAKLTNFKFHDLRHTAASYLAMNGASLLEIAEILGHKTMTMVQRYSHLTKKHTADILERMNEKQFKTARE